MQQKIMSPWLPIKSFRPSGSFCCLLIIFANLLYPYHLLIIFTNLLEQYQTRQTSIRSEFTPFDIDSFHERIFEKVNFEKKSADENRGIKFSQHANSEYSEWSWLMIRLILATWVKVFRIIPEFRISRLPFHRKLASKC